MARRSRSTARAIARACALGALVIAFPGCGDSQPADSELIDASLMRLDDLPTKQDWKIDRSADADDATSKKFAAEIDECEAEGDPTLDKGFPEGESEDFVRLEIRDDDFVTANSSSEVVDDAKLREKFMDGIDPLVGCIGDVLVRYFNEMSPVPIDAAAPYAFKVQSASDAVHGRTLQLGFENGQVWVNGQPTMFADIIVTENAPVLSVAIFIHFGGLTVTEESEIVEAGVARVRGLTR